jgi:hypothetical protein
MDGIRHLRLWRLRHNTGYARIFANALRVETLSKRRKDCKMPAKPALVS